MSVSQSFWSVPHHEGEPPFWVCMSCLSEVFYRKVPMPDCPTCHGVSTYEAFSIEAIRDWGTEDLIGRAAAEETVTAQPIVTAESAPASSVETTP